jgi:hypothetical protein
VLLCDFADGKRVLPAGNFVDVLVTNGHTEEQEVEEYKNPDYSRTPPGGANGVLQPSVLLFFGGFRRPRPWECPKWLPKARPRTAEH